MYRKRIGVIICQSSSQEKPNGMVRGLPKSACSADRYCRMDRTLSWSGRSLSLTRSFYYFSPADWRLHVLDDAGDRILYMDPDQHLYQLYHQVSRKRLGLFSGWSYWVSLVFLGMAEITAVSNYVSFGFQIGQPGRFKLSFSAFKLCKLDRCEGFGEVEFWFRNDQDCHYLP